MAAVLLGLLVLGVLQNLVAERWWLATLVTYLPQPVLLAPAAALLLLAWPWASRSARRGVALGLTVILTGFVHPQVPRPRVVPQGRTVRVTTYNMLHAKRGLEPVIELIAGTRPDVLCLAECNPLGPQDPPVGELLKRLPGWQAVEADDVAILSPYPLADREVDPSGSLLGATIDLAGPVRVYAVHLRNGLGPGHLRHGLRRLPGAIGAAAGVRQQQLDWLLAAAAGQHMPLIAAGDFNTPPRGRYHDRLRRRFRDAFAEAGWGLDYTFRADLPLVRIDYIWCGPGVGVRSCRTLRHAGADHRPVVAELVLPEH